MGYSEVGVFPADSPHGRIPTPNIDQLASEGLRFTDGTFGLILVVDPLTLLRTKLCDNSLHRRSCLVRSHPASSMPT